MVEFRIIVCFKGVQVLHPTAVMIGYTFKSGYAIPEEIGHPIAEKDRRSGAGESKAEFHVREWCI